MGKHFCTGLLKLVEDPPILSERSSAESAGAQKKSRKKSRAEAMDNYQAITDAEKEEESDIGSSMSLDER